MTERPSAERLAELHKWQQQGVLQPIADELLTELDAVTRERNDANKWAQRNEDHATHLDGEVRRLTRERDEAGERALEYQNERNEAGDRISELHEMIGELRSQRDAVTRERDEARTITDEMVDRAERVIRAAFNEHTDSDTPYVLDDVARRALTAALGGGE